MKLIRRAIVLSSLLCYVNSSYADINIKKCQSNGSSYLIFDESDSDQVEKLIKHQLHTQPERRQNSVIKIFTNDNADDRNYWIASFQFADLQNQYLFYQNDKNEFINIDQKQYQTLLPKVVECNQNKQVPFYSENFDSD